MDDTPKATLQGHRCKKCGGHFRRTIITPQPIEQFFADVKAAHCPLCGAGVKSLLMGEGLTLQEDARIRQPGARIELRAANWRLQGEIGQSALAIHDFMTGQAEPVTSHPHDLDDLRRCVLILHHVPEWVARMPEMAAIPGWEKLAPEFKRVMETYLAECPNLDGSAPVASKLFGDLIGRGE